MDQNKIFFIKRKPALGCFISVLVRDRYFGKGGYRFNIFLKNSATNVLIQAQID